MALVLNKPYLVMRTGMKDGKLVVLVQDGDCGQDGLALDKPMLSLRSGVKDGKQVQVAGNQQLDENGNLILNKPYLAVRTGMKDGKLVVLVAGKQCEEGDPPITMCGCEICCTLNATIQVGAGGATWTDAVEVELTCHGTIEFKGGHSCLNDEVEDDTYILTWNQTYSEKTTETFKSRIWASGDFEIDGTTYRLSYWHTETAGDEENPNPSCSHGWVLQVKISDITYGDYWDVVDSYWNGGSNVYGAWVAATLAGIFEYTDDYPGCAEGYSENGGELLIGSGCATNTGNFVGRIVNDPLTTCPVNHYSESWNSNFSTPTCEQKNHCARVAIMDLCSSVTPCATDELFSGYTPTSMDWEVAGCHPASGSADWQGEPCGEFCLFNAGTANIFEGADTTFDENDVPGPVIDFQWCDGEGTYWVNSGGTTGLIEFALCCMTRDDDTTYMAFYALLTLTCGTGIVQYAYKTRDITITPGNPLTISITSLSPFATVANDQGCECDPPVLSIALHYFRPDGCA